MIIPISTDRELRRTPWVNYALIAANVIVFLLTSSDIELINQLHRRGASEQYILENVFVYRFFLHSESPVWLQFFTYQFLHGGFGHIIFNMLFLWVFGNNLEDRLGSLGYLAFYLAGGVVAGMGHAMTSADPVLGASGSVSAVTGAYLALFPLTNVTILFWFFIIHFFEVPSMVLILFSFFRDLLFQFMGGGGVAYLAHISGNIFGFAIGMGLLGWRFVPREPYDMLALLDRWNRRRRFRAATRNGAAPWQSSVSPSLKGGELDESQREVSGARAAVNTALKQDDAGRALEAYERLLGLDPDQVMGRQAQLDVANYAMQAGHYDTAARAYALFLDRFPRDEFAADVRLILGLIHLRYLNDPAAAREHLTEAAERLRDPERRRMAENMLAEAGA